MEKLYKHTIHTPIGFLEITASESFLISVSFVSENISQTLEKPPILIKTIQQLNEYFTGTRKIFELDLNPAGTEFQKRVWKEVEKIPFGKTTSYLTVAIETGSPKNTRAVGLANGKNPIPIIIPCHRVVGKNGKLTGYAGGLDKKKWLILHELNYSKSKERLF